ncbi:unnamed protein product [Cuscuta europaea]|uniref:Replication protein A 70 kDa DNA-binding subunit B/D first OB fold domain-containing protein n=1 Tax=Cuscuta europaea TaxID=41803 RepID=A0A9P0ZH76_CUSEU|nr:unnamed protein product [Cuscuta europaea]
MTSPITYDSISSVSTVKDNWNIKAILVRLWFVLETNSSRPNNHRSLDMLLMDENGCTIHASIRKALIYRFQNILSERTVYSIRAFTLASNTGDFRPTSHKYKINFQIQMKVIKVEDETLLKNSFSLVPISSILAREIDMEVLVDVIRFATYYGKEHEMEINGTKSKRNYIILEADSCKIRCILFQPYVDELNLFLSSGKKDNDVVIVQLAKARRYKGIIMHFYSLMFDREASMMWNKSCVEMLDELDKDGSLALPKQLTDMVDKELLFKVAYRKSSNPRFPPTFPIKRVCDDAAIIQKFKELHLPNVNSVSESSCSVRNASISPNDTLSQNLMSKFEDLDNESQMQQTIEIDIATESVEISNNKRAYSEDTTSKPEGHPKKGKNSTTFRSVHQQLEMISCMLRILKGLKRCIPYMMAICV